jgi:release factor glutamine methyltransferase
VTATIGKTLREGAVRLTEAGIEDPAADARRLMAHVLGLDPARLTLVAHDAFPAASAAAWGAALAARLQRRPVAQITGRRAFYGHEFRVTADTLDPRPETELLVDEALSRPFARMLDLGTGTGCILLSCLAANPAATGLGTDLSDAALSVAAGNAEALGLLPRAAFRHSDWFTAVPDSYDLIVSNPPYIAEAELPTLAPEVRDWEPRLALTPGGDGLDAYRAISRGAPARLRPGGRLIVEIGWQQGPDVAAMFAAVGLSGIRVLRDLNGRDRVVSATR